MLKKQVSSQVRKGTIPTYLYITVSKSCKKTGRKRFFASPVKLGCGTSEKKQTQAYYICAFLVANKIPI